MGVSHDHCYEDYQCRICFEDSKPSEVISPCKARTLAGSTAGILGPGRAGRHRHAERTLWGVGAGPAPRPGYWTAGRARRWRAVRTARVRVRGARRRAGGANARQPAPARKQPSGRRWELMTPGPAHMGILPRRAPRGAVPPKLLLAAHACGPCTHWAQAGRVRSARQNRCRVLSRPRRRNASDCAALHTLAHNAFPPPRYNTTPAPDAPVANRSARARCATCTPPASASGSATSSSWAMQTTSAPTRAACAARATRPARRAQT